MKALLHLLIFSTYIVAWKATAQTYQEEFQIIDAFLHEEYPENQPGAVVLIAKDGEIIYRKAFGLANLRKKKPLQTDMIFQLGSMTKQFTSAAVLQLVEQNKVSLDDKIQKYVEYYRKKEYEITIAHLLSQTSGIPEFFDVDESELELLSQEHTPQQLIAYYADKPLLFQPGTQFQYSNSNYPLLGVVIEKASGLSLEEYFDNNLFMPLGMNSTSLWYKDDFKKKRIAEGYRTNEGALEPSPEIVGSIVYAAGGIVSTVDDLFLWNEALKDKSLLSEDIVRQLTTEKTTLNGAGTGYGYGFFIKELLGRKIIEHGGLIHGFTSSGLYIPEEDIYVCVLANKVYERTEEVANYLASIVMGEPISILGRSALNYEAQKEYLGTYQLQGGEAKLIEIKLVEDLMILDFPQAPGTGVEIVKVEGDHFKSVKADIAITFLRDNEGTITGLSGTQGETYTWTKLR
ncbi:serine hydrolase domain-containing protein [Catalinimonas sp. 4WD22]|uniref:serine hydrolase domain-containing protein n=1 Tax=Catalinimonas locisalis TaxID=3133978 RepID=UPI003100B8D1